MKTTAFISILLLSTTILAEESTKSIETITQSPATPSGQMSDDEKDAVADKEAAAIVVESKNTVAEIKEKLPESEVRRKKSFEEMDDTMQLLLQTLAKDGVISENKAKEIVEAAKTKALQAEKQGDEATHERIVRVPYVPESVKQNLRDEVRSGLRSDVLEDVIAHARSERWGIPDALPGWTSKIKWKGDFRMRAENQFMDNANAQFLNYSSVNSKGGIFSAGNDAFENSTIDRARARIRARLGMDAKISTNTTAAIRLATGSSNNPVSTNQTLGNFGQASSVQWDRAYVDHSAINLDGYTWMKTKLGRFSSPWYSTDLVWDSDLAFEGVYSSFHFNLSGGEDLDELNDQSKSMWFGLGAFPIQEIELTQNDKWLLGAQLGSEVDFSNQTKLTFGIAYYDFVGMQGKRFNAEDNVVDPVYYRSSFMQKGNTLFDIREDTDTTKDLWALAADYNIVNATIGLDLANFAPIHMILTLDYAKNIGYDADEIAQRTAQSATSNVIDEQTEAYQVIVSVGWPHVELPGNWRASGAYRYLERDAVLDSFTDSDFHSGGTNTRGWWLGFDYGLEEMTWVSLKWMTADEIKGAPLALDLLQLDFNARF